MRISFVPTLGPATLYHARMSNIRTPPVQLAYATAVVPTQQLPPTGMAPPPNCLPTLQGSYNPQGDMVQPIVGGANQRESPSAAGGIQHAALTAGQHPGDVVLSNSVQVNYLMAAYRVGMLAMDTLARRVHDDRPHVKYARNPPYGEEVKWLHGISMKLGK